MNQTDTLMDLLEESETYIENGEFFLAKESIKEAEKMCNLLCESELKQEFELCVCIDYSKLYLDFNQFQNAEDYVIKAFKLSQKSKNKELILSAIHNFIIFVFSLNLLEEERQKVLNYGILVERILLYDLTDLPYTDIVMLFLIMSDFSFIKGDVEHGQTLFERAYELERGEDGRIPFVYGYILERRHILHKFLGKEILKEVLLYIAHQVPDYVNHIVNEKDNIVLFHLSKQISAILRCIVSYVNLGIITCTDSEYLEVIANLKNIYLSVLKIQKANKRGKTSYLEWLEYSVIIEKIPEEYIYIDYIQFPFVLRREQMLGDLALSFISVKKDRGKVLIERYEPIHLLEQRALHMMLNALTRTSRNTEELRFFSKLLNNDNALCKNLYNLLLKPVFENHVDKKKGLLISADVELNYIPFSLFVNENGEYMIERYHILQTSSLRDFDGEVTFEAIDCTNALIIGNPQFSIDRTQNYDSKNLFYLEPLPLSKVESEIVSETLGVLPVMKRAAKKSVFDKIDASLLHLATHGSVGEIKEEEEGLVFPLSRCCIYLSGANDYIYSGQELEEYGNGVITAEEMLEYDLSSINMAVLSVCFSGNGEVDYSQGILGFRTVLQANGVRIIVSALWEVHDFAAAIFMADFYKNIKTMKGAEALRKSQLYLKKISIKELKDEGWFDEKRIKKIGLVAEEMRRIARLPDETKIFENPKFWAGFIIIV